MHKGLTQGEIEKTQAAIAKRKEVSRRSIGHVRRVYRIGDPAVQDAVADRLISMSDASEIVEEPSDVQQKAIALVRGKKVTPARRAVEHIYEDRERAEDATSREEKRRGRPRTG